MVEDSRCYDSSQIWRHQASSEAVAFIGALCACTHAGLVDQGREILDSMTRRYGIKPKLEHYGCMVDLLAHIGLLNEARDLVESMPMEPDALVWGALMAGCKVHRNVELAEHAVKHLIQLEPDSSGVYVLLTNVYASSGRRDDARKVGLLMKKKQVEKTHPRMQPGGDRREDSPVFGWWHCSLPDKGYTAEVGTRSRAALGWRAMCQTRKQCCSTSMKRKKKMHLLVTVRSWQLPLCCLAPRKACQFVW
ncbi:unnamed protein product [Musa hybrid cultivar]